MSPIWKATKARKHEVHEDY